MLLKWLFLIILAWYIYRAAGNLIAAARGEQPPINGPQQGSRPGSRPGPGFGRPGFDPRSQHAPYDDGPPLKVVKKRSADQGKHHRPAEEDVEDARFTDL